MSGDSEYGRCDVCGESAILTRTYFEYPVECECHSPCHFEYIATCENCEAKEPTHTELDVSTAWLKEACKRMKGWTPK